MSASADIEKLAVFDSRIIQKRPKFAVQKGALSITNTPFNAIAKSQSQLTFNVQVPSLNVFMDRTLTLTASPAFVVNVDIPAGTPDGGILQDDAPAVATFGRDCALPAFPLHNLMNTLTATINDTTSTINVNDVLYEVLRLTDMKRNRLQRTCPTMLDKYLNYDDAALTANNPLSSYSDATDYDNVPNGAFYQVQFLDPNTSQPLTGNGNYTYQGNLVEYRNGIPVLTLDAGAPGFFRTTYPIAYRYTTQEKLVLSPFIFSEVHSQETGLFGINNIQLVVNLGSAAHNLRVAPRASAAVGGVGAVERTFGSPAFLGSDPFGVARVDCMFRTPSLEVALPPKNIVPYMEFPRYITTGANIPAGGSATIQSQTITLPQIPDMLVIFCRPRVYNGSQGNYYLPISSINVNFDNFSGLLSSMTAAELYQMSVDNGLDMDWNTWSGRAIRADATLPNNLPSTFSPSLQRNQIATVGGFLVIRPARDLALQSGLAPSVIGNYQLQFSVGVENNSTGAVDADLYVIAVNSGFFESVAGSSRILKGVLTEQDVISAPRAMDSDGLHRYVGGRSKFFSALGNALMKVAKSPVVKSMAKAGLKEGAKMLGLGANVAGAGMAGAGKSNMRALM